MLCGESEQLSNGSKYSRDPMSKQPQKPVSHAVFEERGGCLYKWYMTSAAASHDDSPLFAVNITPGVGIQKVELNFTLARGRFSDAG